MINKILYAGGIALILMGIIGIIKFLFIETVLHLWVVWLAAIAGIVGVNTTQYAIKEIRNE